MLDPDPEWWSIPQGPHEAPPNVWHLLNDETGKPKAPDSEIMRLVMSGYAGGRAEDGSFEGLARGKYNPGYQYEGQYLASLTHGMGKYTWDDGTSYTGSSSDNAINGVGTYSYPNGDTYQGEVVNGVREGHGTYTKQVGESYVGHWSQGLKHGKGRLAYSPFTWYDGDWIMGNRTGEGTMVYATGSTYVGSWVNNKRHGTGSMVWKKDGRVVAKYVGSWCEGEMQGEGTHWYYSDYNDQGDANPEAPSRTGTGSSQLNMTDKQPTIEPRSSERSLTKPHTSSATMNNTVGSVGSAGSSTPTPSTTGGTHTAVAAAAASAQITTLDMVEVNYYRGDFKLGRRHGQGSFLYRDGGRYEGAWEGNMKHGSGIFYLDSGVCFQGMFSEDKPNGSIGGPDKPALNRYVPLEIDDLLMSEVNPDAAKALVEALISRHYWDLRQLYRHYSTSNLDSECRKTHLTSLSIMQFWRFVKETRISEHGFSLAEADRIFLRFQTSYKSINEKEPSKEKDRRDTNVSLQQKKKRSSSVLGSLYAEHHGGSRSVRDGKTPEPNRRAPAPSVSRAAHSGHDPNLPPLKTVRNVHSGEGCMYFREFVEAVVRIAHAKYQCYPSLSLANKLQMCLSTDLKPRDTTGDACFYKDVNDINAIALKHSRFLLKLFSNYAQKNYRGLSLHKQRPKNDIVVTVRQFLTLLRDAGVVDKSAFPLRKALDMFDAPSPMTSMIDASAMSPSGVVSEATEIAPTYPLATTQGTVSSAKSDSVRPLLPYPPGRDKKV